MIDKKVLEAIKLVKDLRQLMLETDWGGVSVTKGAFRQALQTLISIAEATTCKKVSEIEGFLPEKTPQTIFGPDLSPKEHREMAMKENIYCLGYKHAREEIGNLSIRLKPLDVGEIEKIIEKFNRDYWEKGGVEESEIVPSRARTGLAQAIHDHFTLPKEELDWKRVVKFFENEYPLLCDQYDMNFVAKALCQAYSKGLLKKE